MILIAVAQVVRAQAASHHPQAVRPTHRAHQMKMVGNVTKPSGVGSSKP